MRLNEGFRALAATTQDAPPGLEARLVREFRRRGAMRRYRTAAWIGAAVAVAAGLIAIVVLRPQEPGRPPLLVAQIPAPPIRKTARPAAVTVKRRPDRAAAPQTTQFYPLPAVDGPLEYGAVMRVELPRSAMRMVGLPVNEERMFERVQADVLVGQDGTARAVRFFQ